MPKYNKTGNNWKFKYQGANAYFNLTYLVQLTRKSFSGTVLGL